MKIDLTFKKFLSQKDDGYSNFIHSKYNSEEFWEDNFRKWFTYLSSQSDYYYPHELKRFKSLSLAVEFIDDFRMMQLNSDWRSVNSSTDVLSFPILDTKFSFQGDIVEIGDIFVSIPKAFQQSKEFNNGISYEVSWLLSHGLLHLLGWDHTDDETLEKMLSCQKSLLQRLKNV